MTHDLASGQTRMAPSHAPERLAATRVWVADPGCGRRAEKARRSWSLRPRGRPVDRSSQLAAKTSVPGGNRSRDPSTPSQPHPLRRVRALRLRPGACPTPALGRAGAESPARSARSEASGPWRGTKPMEGSGVEPLETASRHNGLVGGARP